MLTTTLIYERLKHGIFILFLFGFCALPLIAQTDSNSPIIDLSNPNDLIYIGNQVTYLEDPDGVLTLQDILSPGYQKQFQQHNNILFSRPATKSAFWFKITMRNTTNEDAWLEVGSTYAWYVDFYSMNANSINKEIIRTGSMRPEENKPYDVNLFWLPLNKAGNNSLNTYYVRIQSGLTYELPLAIGTVRSLTKNKTVNDYLTAGFIGLVLVMLIYNAFLYASTKENIYIYYLGYLALMLISMPYANNYPFIQKIDFWFIDKAWWNEKFLLWHPPVYYFIGVFCIRFLHLAENGKLMRRIILGEIAVLSGLFPLLTLLGLPFVTLVNIIQVCILIFYLTCLGSGYYFAYKRDVQAKYYVVGWTFMVLGAFVFFGTINGLIPFNHITRNALYIGTAIEVSMFSLALGNRINILQKEKQAIQEENLSIVQAQNKALEKEVKNRTNELTVTNKKLLQSNKELRATTEELDNHNRQLSETNHMKDRLFAAVSHDIKAPFIALSNLIQVSEEKGITEKTMDVFITKLKKESEYIEFLMNNLLQWSSVQMSTSKSDKEQVDIGKLIDENLSALKDFTKDKQLHIVNNIPKYTEVYADINHVRFILRNIINNALKYTPKGGYVTVNTSHSNDSCELSISDNGIGIEQSKLKALFQKQAVESDTGTNGEKGAGVGLMLCQEFIERNSGSIRAESEKGKGSTFIITLPVRKCES